MKLNNTLINGKTKVLAFTKMLCIIQLFTRKMAIGMTKKVTISLTHEQQEKARYLSKDLFGKENISGLVGFLIERWDKEQKIKNTQT